MSTQEMMYLFFTPVWDTIVYSQTTLLVNNVCYDMLYGTNDMLYGTVYVFSIFTAQPCM